MICIGGAVTAEMNAPVVYGLRHSVYTRTVLMTLAEKGVTSEFTDMDVFDVAGLPKCFLKLNPFGKIPVLVHGGVVLYETSAITRYIDEAFPGPSLQPAGATARARMHQVIATLDAYGYRPLIWPLFVERISVPLEGGVPDEVAIASVLPAAELCLDALEGFLVECSDRLQQVIEPIFFAGKQISLADMHAVSMLLYFQQTPEAAQMLPSRVKLSQWLGSVKQRPSVQGSQTKYGF